MNVNSKFNNKAFLSFFDGRKVVYRWGKKNKCRLIYNIDDVIVVYLIIIILK